MHNRLVVLAALSWIVCCPAVAQERPLQTDNADLVGVGRIRTEVGIDFLQNQRYSLSGLEGDLVRLGVASIHVGVGEYAEFQISGVLQDYLSVSSHNSAAPIPFQLTGNSTNDFGDIVLASKFRFAPEKGARPSLGFKFAVQLPNASQTTGLGADETEFCSSLLASKHVKSLWLMANAGLAILANPLSSGQADMLTYGFGMIIPVHRTISLIAEINGRRGPERIGNEAQSVVRAGAQIRAGSLRWDLAAVAGLKRFDPDSGVSFGVTYEFQAFHRRSEPGRPR
jgi:hypothetical protein